MNSGDKDKDKGQTYKILYVDSNYIVGETSEVVQCTVQMNNIPFTTTCYRIATDFLTLDQKEGLQEPFYPMSLRIPFGCIFDVQETPLKNCSNIVHVLVLFTHPQTLKTESIISLYPKIFLQRIREHRALQNYDQPKVEVITNFTI